jgi:threonine dehydrogenase-like Zn-dependent dehydrogenase
MSQNQSLLAEERVYDVVELQGQAAALHRRPWPRSAVAGLVVRPLLAGICRSDIKDMQQARFRASSFGHEIVATVEHCTATPTHNPGDLVCFNPNVPLWRTSGFATYMFGQGTPDELAQAFPKLDPGLEPRRLVFVETMACAHHCVETLFRHIAGRQSGRREELKIAVVGAGIFGALIAMITSAHCCPTHLYNRGPEKLDFLGGRAVLPAVSLRRLADIPADTYDVVIPATSMISQDVLRTCIGALRPGGWLHLFGGTKETDTLPGNPLNIHLIRTSEQACSTVVADKALNVGGCYGATAADFASVGELLKDTRRFPVERLISAEIPLEAVPAELQRMASDGYEGKVVVVVDERLASAEARSATGTGRR